MKLLEKLQDCCMWISDSIEGTGYGWSIDIVSWLLLPIAFHFFAKWAVRKLHAHFIHQNKMWHDSLIQSLYGPLCTFVWFFALFNVILLIAERLFPKISLFQNQIHLILPIAALLILAWFLFNFKNRFVSTLTEKRRRHEVDLELKKIDMINKCMTFSIFFFIGLLLLEVTHSNLSTIIAFGGIGGLAIAFASQTMIANFFGGLMIYSTNPFSKGEWIHLPEKGIEGFVEEIGWYLTDLRSFDKRPIYIPNSVLSSTIVITPSRMTHRQLKETICLRYEAQPYLKIILESIRHLLQKHPEIDQESPIRVHINALNVYSIDVSISAFSNVVDFEAFSLIKDDILLKVGEIINQQVPKELVSDKNLGTTMDLEKDE
jgi:MscS family membrane protein